MRIKESPKKTGIVFAIMTVLGGVLVGYLFFLQVVSGEYYKSLAERQHSYSAELSPRRGSIYMRDASGETVEVAGTKEGYGIYINPHLLNSVRWTESVEDGSKYLEEIYQKISAITELDRNFFMERASKTDDPFEVVRHRVDRERAMLIQNLGIGGVGIIPEEWRFYPAGDFASHVIGFVGYNEDKLEGRYGVERYFEEVLKGEKGYVEGEKTAAGFLLDLGRVLLHSPREGYDVVLTINIDVQLFLENKLDALMEQWKTESAAGIVIEPKTGKVLAMAGRPSFDPNSYANESDISIFKNPLIANLYEMGSVFKPLTIASAIDAGAITPDTTYFDEGFLVIDGMRIANYDNESRGTTNMQAVLNESINTGAVFAQQRMGKERFYDYMLSFGLDSKTDVELPGEAMGNLRNLDSPRDIEYATASYGQGVSVTGIAASRAFAALANGGMLMRPYLVERIMKPGGVDLITEPEEQGRVIKKETSEIINKMLVITADEGILGSKVKDPDYTMAAKTGTAFIPRKDGPGYSDDLLHSFFGYGPGFDPQFLVFLYVEKPQGVRYASQSLRYAFADIMKFLFNYYNVEPDR